MEKLHTAIVISAQPEKIWDTMLGNESYPRWADTFHPGSYYEGTLAAGERVLFLGPMENGEVGGMISRVAEIRPPEFISFAHLGIIKNGVEDTESAEAKRWAPAFENYTFTAVEGGTEVSIDMDIESEYLVMFTEMWEKALSELKKMVEK